MSCFISRTRASWINNYNMPYFPDLTRKIVPMTCMLVIMSVWSLAQPAVKLKKKDLKRDVEIRTTEGNILLRLSNETPQHRDNFLKLVKTGFYKDIKFHRVIKGFVIQAGDPGTRRDSIVPKDSVRDKNYTIPAEFRPGLHHKRGALAAARTGDDVNPQKASSGFQFYIVHGRTFTDRELDSVEIARLQGRKIPGSLREMYKTTGGTPQLDQNYTVFGEVVEGMTTVDQIASQPTTGAGKGDRPLKDIRIINTKLVRRKK